MEEDFYSPSLLASLLSSGTQGFPTPQPVTVVPYYEDTSSYQMQPTPQPVMAVPYTEAGSTVPPLAISPEEIARLEARIAEQRAQYAALNDPAYIANQQAKEDWLKQQASQGTYYTPAYNPLDFSANSGGILNLFGPPAPQPAFDPSNPTANMQQVYYFDNGVRGSVPDPVTGQMVERNAHPLTFEAGQTYKMLDAKGNVVGTASTPAEMQNLVKLPEQMPAYSMQLEGNQYGNTLPSGGWLPNKTNAGSFGSMILPMLALAGAGFGLSALGLGAAGGGAAAGTGAGAAGTAAGAGTAAAGAGTAAAAGAGTAGAAGTAAGLAPLVGPGWTVLAPTATGLTTTGAVLGGSTLAGALAAAANAPGATSYANQVWGDQASAPTGGEANLSYVDPVTGDIVVPSGTTSFPIDPNSILAGFLGSFYPPLTSVNIPPLADTTLPDIPSEDIPEGTGEDIVVNAPPGGTVLPPVPFPIANVQFPAPPLNSVTIPPGAGTTLPPTKTPPSLLDQIIKYVTVGSGVADLLGGGGGGARQPTTTPNYGSLLGGVPNFGRGPFTPFTGDYEKYAFGPEWNFFGGSASAPAVTGALPIATATNAQGPVSLLSAAAAPTTEPTSFFSGETPTLANNEVYSAEYQYTPEWKQAYLDFMTGQTNTLPPRLEGNSPEEWSSRMQTVRGYGPEIAQETLKYWDAVRADPRFAEDIAREQTTKQGRPSGEPYVPEGYTVVNGAVLPISLVSRYATQSA